MKKLWSLVVLSLAALAIVLSPRSARATEDAEAQRLEAHGKALQYTMKTVNPPSRVDTGGAAILVNAPIAEVRKVVTNYNSYTKFLRPFDQSRLLTKRKGVSEVYLQVPILSGAAHIWVVTAISPPVKDGAGEAIVARMQRGNVADFRAVWRLRAVDADHTVLKLELLVDPKIPFASSLITKHLLKSADKGVTRVRERAQAAWAKKRRAKPPAASAAEAAPSRDENRPAANPQPRAEAAADTTSPNKVDDVARR